MRGEILGFERRRRWSDEEKLGIVMAVGVDDATVTQVAQRHEITRQQIYAWADKGYVSAERAAAYSGPSQFWGVMRNAPKVGKLDPIEETINRIIAKVRAKVEHPFRVIKCQFGHVKTRYRGLARNRAQLFTLFALGNLFVVRRKLMA